MEIFKSKKTKYVFWGYFIVSFIFLLLSAFFLDGYDKAIENPNPLFKPKPTDAFLAANFFVLIPLTYIIMIAFLIMKYRMHKTRLLRYKKFSEYPQADQEQYLNKVFCEKCRSYNKVFYVDEKMIEGMKWVECICEKCEGKNRIRIN